MAHGSDRSEAARDTHEQRVLFDLVRDLDGELGAALTRITAAAVHTLGVSRASVWIFGPARTTLTCLGCTSTGDVPDSTGARLEASRYPAYFEALSNNRTVAATDARADRRTRELGADYLEPQEIVSMLDVPVWCGGEMIGVLCHEVAGQATRPWSAADRRFAASMADVVSMALAARERAALADEESRLRTKLSKERALLDQVLRQLPAGVVITDAHCGVRFANDAAVRIWRHPFRAGEPGLEEIDVRGADGTPIPADQLPHARATRERAVVRAVLWFRAGEGYRAVSCVAGPLREDDTDRVGSVLTCLDVTAEMEARRLEQESAQVRGRLLDFLGHDLRNPLTVITLLSDALRRQEHGDPRRSAERILAAAWRMQALLRDALDYARAWSGLDLHVLPTPTDLDALCRRVVDELRAAGPEREIEVETHGPVEGLWDHERMEQAISMLLLHALQEGGPGAPVRLIVRSSEDDAELVVRGTGGGIAELRATLDGHAPLPSEPPEDPLGRYVLGVRLVREIAHAHGGSVSLTDDDDVASVSLRLPKRPPGAAGARRRPPRA